MFFPSYLARTRPALQGSSGNSCNYVQAPLFEAFHDKTALHQAVDFNRQACLAVSIMVTNEGFHCTTSLYALQAHLHSLSGSTSQKQTEQQGIENTLLSVRGALRCLSTPDSACKACT